MATIVLSDKHQTTDRKGVGTTVLRISLNFEINLPIPKPAAPGDG